MDKQNVVYTNNGILFNIKNKRNSDTCYNMDEPWRHYAKWNKPVTKGQILYDFTYNEVHRVIKCIDTESRMLVAKGSEEEKMGSYYLKGIEFQFGKIKNVLDMGGGGACTTMWMYLILLKHMLKNGKFCYVYFSTIKY